MRQEANDEVAANCRSRRTWDPGLDEPFKQKLRLNGGVGIAAR
jgi:hypothetical protein